MHRRRVAACCLALAALAFALVAGAARREAEPISAELALKTMDGGSVDFGELRGEVVLLDFWATWCKPCREATPHLERLAGRMEGRPFAIVGISADNDRQALEAYLEKEGVPWPQVWDGGGQAVRAFGVSSFPTYLVIDHEGRPVSKLTGWGSSHSAALGREVLRHVRRAEKAAKRNAAVAR
jgi:thiol-disulfide isomerase/thioredoxin